VTALVSVLKCDHCGALAVAIDGTRITAHKCAGVWTTLVAEVVDGALLRRAVAESEPVTLGQVARDFVEGTLRRCVGNKTLAARELGIDRRTLYRYLADPNRKPRVSSEVSS
jgi:transcriptional regulator of acetoin/glycerol metabolism